MTLLDVKTLTKSFGGIRALNGLDLQVSEGEILGVIGPNGAGKSTLFNVIAGSHRPDAGRVLLGGADITGLKPHEICKRGVTRNFQQNVLFSDRSVMDNVRLGFHRVARWGIAGFLGVLFHIPSQRRSEEAIDEAVLEILRFVGMTHLRGTPAGSLSYGYQRTLAMAIALAARPRLLLLDEPVTALNPERVASIMALIRAVRDRGTTVVMVEHNLRAIFDTCDRIVVLNYGQKLAEGTPVEVRENSDVIGAYLGKRRTFP